MQDHDNDRLEQFFRKAISRPEVTFSESDWSKLQTRLDAEDAVAMSEKKSAVKLIVATTLCILLVVFIATWITSQYELSFVRKATVQHERLTSEEEQTPVGESKERGRVTEDDAVPPTDERRARVNTESHVSTQDKDVEAMLPPGKSQTQTNTQNGAGDRPGPRENYRVVHPDPAELFTSDQTASMQSVEELPPGRIADDFIGMSITRELRNKQKAMVELPGAEEAESGLVESMAGQENVSDQNGHMTTPRLSLLLSYAPDFSSTSISRYSAPGKAFGGMLHYHLRARWSLAAGLVKNDKQYQGNGEDYTPPKGYWKYYTNGRIPNTVDGTCDVIEFPVMVQYLLHQRRKTRLYLGAGTSSYLMMNESYRYHFDEPNPGAKQGWSSKNRSTFTFNMVNLTMAYECEILPGFMLGVEPYLKIPIEEIGWSNLRLFSTGASINMRYVILRRSSGPVIRRSRGPD